MIAQRQPRETKPAGPTLADYWQQDLAPDGYRRCVPDPVDVAEAVKARCECGHVGLECHGYRRPGSYRAFWTCECGRCEEV